MNKGNTLWPPCAHNQLLWTKDGGGGSTFNPLFNPGKCMRLGQGTAWSRIVNYNYLNTRIFCKYTVKDIKWQGLNIAHLCIWLRCLLTPYVVYGSYSINIDWRLNEVKGKACLSHMIDTPRRQGLFLLLCVRSIDYSGDIDIGGTESKASR